MTSLTIKNIPDPLYQELKRTARAHRRSINNEVIVLLEEKLLAKGRTPDEWIAAARKIRSKIPAGAITEEDIENTINEGRP